MHQMTFDISISNILDFSAINALHINTDSQLMVANHVIVMRAVQRASNAMLPVSVHVTTTSKEDDATDAKKTNITVIKDVWIVPTVTTWFEMQPTIIVANWLI